ncbi:MAG: hypothetical protein WD689_02870 [Gaiellaceae bacterium]
MFEQHFAAFELRFLICDDGEIIGELRPQFHLLLQAGGTADHNGAIRSGAEDKPRNPKGASRFE